MHTPASDVEDCMGCHQGKLTDLGKHTKHDMIQILEDVLHHGSKFGAQNAADVFQEEKFPYNHLANM